MTAMPSVRVAARDLTRCVAAALRAAGATDADAECVASALVASDLAGHASHGIIRAPSYLEAIDQGSIDLRARPELTGEDGATARVDGHDGFGQVAGRFAMDVAIRKAREHGVSSVALVRTTHVGRLGDYVELAADAGMVGLGFCTATSAAGRVAPYGSVEPVFGTNPFAAAIPSADGRTVLCDFATSVVAEGKLQIAVNKGESVPGRMAAEPLRRALPPTRATTMRAGRCWRSAATRARALPSSPTSSPASWPARAPAPCPVWWRAMGSCSS